MDLDLFAKRKPKVRLEEGKIRFSPQSILSQCARAKFYSAKLRRKGDKIIPD